MRTAKTLYGNLCAREFVEYVIRTVMSLTKVVELDCTISSDLGKILLQPFDVDPHNSPFKSMFPLSRCWIKTRLPYRSHDSYESMIGFVTS